ncbi:MAG: hypothetical protein J5753_01300 [Oscillospiraceae bacterium]|nr:hypothetical protein [Oscillospiraceae bacterium]
MPNNQQLFANPDMIRALAQQIRTLSGQIKQNINDVALKIKSTESIYVANSATEMRDKFEALKPELEKYEAYLLKVANYLEQNIADPLEIVERVASQNVASISKPQ